MTDTHRRTHRSNATGTSSSATEETPRRVRTATHAHGVHSPGRLAHIKRIIIAVVCVHVIILVRLRGEPYLARGEQGESSMISPGAEEPSSDGRPASAEGGGKAQYNIPLEGVTDGGRKLGAQHDAADATTSTSTTTTFAPGVNTSCLDPDGPRPYILMTLGRSGSGSTWQIIGNLTGRETDSDELTGNGIVPSETFFGEVGDEHDAGGQWMIDAMCAKQRENADDPAAGGGVVGFKWKPFRETIYSVPAQRALELLAARRSLSNTPTIKIVRLRRNLLDVLISKQKHYKAKSIRKAAPKHDRRKKRLDAHCMKNDEKCKERHLAAGTGLHLPIRGMVEALRNLTKQEDDVDRMLDRLGVPALYVSYEKLYLRHDTEEWMRIFRFLGVGPGEGLKWDAVETAMRHEFTSNGFHNETLRNYGEVERELLESEFAALLH